MASPKTPRNKEVKKRVPNAFMIFVKEKNRDLLQNCPDEEKAKLGAHLGRIWRSMPMEDKKVYFDKYKERKKLEDNMLESNPTVSGEKVTQNEINIASDDDFVEDKRTVDKPFSAEETLDAFNNGTTSTNGLGKQKPKKTRRFPNAFMVFSKEQRLTLSPSSTKGRGHGCTILGNMWRELPATEKTKYYLEAKRLQEEQTADSNKIRKNNRPYKKVPIKTVERSRRKKIVSDAHIDLENKEVNDVGKTEIESNFNKPSDVIINADTTASSSELHACNTHSNSVSVQLPNSAPLHNFGDPFSSFRSPNVCCCQSAPLPPAFHPYSYYPPPPPWMIPSMLPPPPPPPLPFTAPYNYGFPYSYNSAYNGSGSYFGYYAAQYSRRVAEPFMSAQPTTPSATATTVTIIGDAHGEEKVDENSDGEQVVVDEDSSEKQPHGNETA